MSGRATKPVWRHQARIQVLVGGKKQWIEFLPARAVHIEVPLIER